MIFLYFNILFIEDKKIDPECKPNMIDEPEFIKNKVIRVTKKGLSSVRYRIQSLKLFDNKVLPIGLVHKMNS